MNTRLATSLTILMLLTVSCPAWGQVSGDPFSQTGADGSIPGGAVIAALYVYFLIAYTLFMIASLWILFAKAGEPGWACLIPIYNVVVLLQISGKPWWWVILYMIPVVSIVISIVHMIALAEAFGKGAGYGIGLVFLGFIFLPLLAFGDASYEGSWGGV